MQVLFIFLIVVWYVLQLILCFLSGELFANGEFLNLTPWCRAYLFRYSGHSIYKKVR